MNINKLLFAMRRYVTFFLLIAFIITCCMLMFLTSMQKALNIEFTSENTEAAAILTFINVIFLSLVCTIIDGIRRKLMVERPVRRITEATQKIMNGDLTARIEPFRSIDSGSGFDIIIEHFNRMAEELSGLETLRTDFIANVSHELKTPLSVIQNYGTLLQSPDLTSEQRIEYSKAITASSRRLADLITNILKLNRLENQQIFPTAKKFDLGEQLAECLLDFENVWEEKNIDIDTDIEENIIIYSDSELLSLVWNNLFSNAFKFTDNGGKVFISLKKENDKAVIKISDTGCGISPETGKHIFEKFYQGDTSHAVQGNGLGLALVKRVIDIVKAEISVQSEVGKGTEFTVKIGCF